MFEIKNTLAEINDRVDIAVEFEDIAIETIQTPPQNPKTTDKMKKE